MDNTPRQIVSFDSSYILTAVYRSISEAAFATGTLRQSIIKAVYGKIISVKQRYWRVIPPDFELSPDDMGQLTLFEFDKMVGEDRRIYASKKMTKSSAMLESEYIKKYGKQL